MGVHPYRGRRREVLEKGREHMGLNDLQFTEKGLDAAWMSFSSAC